MNPMMMMAILGKVGSGLGGLAKSGMSMIDHALDRENQNAMQKKLFNNQIKMQEIGQNFQEHMASTNYQRTVKDMKKAGLNPALALTSGAPAQLKSTNDFESQKTIFQTLLMAMSKNKNFQMSPLRAK